LPCCKGNYHIASLLHVVMLFAPLHCQGANLSSPLLDRTYFIKYNSRRKQSWLTFPPHVPPWGSASAVAVIEDGQWTTTAPRTPLEGALDFFQSQHHCVIPVARSSGCLNRSRMIKMVEKTEVTWSNEIGRFEPWIRV
jgi:hypothetical protein